MSKFNTPALTEEEIEEELINNDLLNSGAVEDQEALQQMNLEEKKSLLRCINQSKEDFRQEAGSTVKQLKKPIIIDTTPSEFPSLPTPKTNKLRLSRTQSRNGSSDSQKCISLLDDEDDETFGMKQKEFSLPFFVSDDAPPLPRPDQTSTDKCPYYQMRGELRTEALKRMLSDHDSWKNKYVAEMRKLESGDTVEDIQDEGDNEQQGEESGNGGESDPYTFKEDPKTYSNVSVRTKKKDAKKDLDTTPNSRTPQRRTSRDSDCEEVTPILKPDEPKLSEWMTAAKPRNKRNRKQNSKTHSQTDIEFDETRSLWGSPATSSAPSPRYSSTRMPQVQEEEEKVQCPICQQNYTLSTIENHAATCEGFSGSPMDVEEG